MRYEVSLRCLQEAALIPILRSNSPCAGQEVGIQLHLFTSAVGGGERSASRSDKFTSYKVKSAPFEQEEG